MANFTTTASSINAKLPAFYSLPTTPTTKLPTSTLPYPNPLPVGDALQAATFTASSAATNSFADVFGRITLTATATTGAVPVQGTILTINGFRYGVLSSSSTTSPSILTLTCFSNEPILPATGSYTGSGITGTYTGASFVTISTGIATENNYDYGENGQSYIALFFATNQNFDVNAVYQPSGSTNWIYPMAMIYATANYCFVAFPADVVPAYMGGALTLTRSTKIPVLGDVLTLSDSTNAFTYSNTTNDKQWNYWRISA